MALAACSSNGSTGTSAPTPAPTPTPVPTPTPTPTASYTKFDALTGDQTYLTGCSLGIYSPSTGTIPDLQDTSLYSQGLRIAYTAATDSYVISGDGLSVRYGPADYASQSGGVKMWVKNDGAELFTIETPIADTPLDYARATFLDTLKDGVYHSYGCITGVPTLTFDVPTTSTITYTVQGGINATGRFSEDILPTIYSLPKGIGTFQVDFAMRKIQTTLHLIGLTAGQGAPRKQIDLGSVTGTGTIDPVSGAFSGTWTSTDHDVAGSFKGIFFGPQAQEFGYAFAIRGKDSGGAALFETRGVLNGKR